MEDESNGDDMGVTKQQSVFDRARQRTAPPPAETMDRYGPKHVYCSLIEASAQFQYKDCLSWYMYMDSIMKMRGIMETVVLSSETLF